MKDMIQTKLYRIAVRLEILVGICILAVVAASTIGLFLDIRLSEIISRPESLQNYLTAAMTIIIGIEFVKMIFSYTIDTVVEVMMLAVARQMVLTHTSPIDNLITITSVALLFVIRKFLFIRQLDHHEESHAVESLLPHFRRRDYPNTQPENPAYTPNQHTSHTSERKEEDTHVTP